MRTSDTPKTNHLAVCVILPAYNEAKVIQSVLRKIPTNMRISGINITLSLVVIDDGSSDNTAIKATEVNKVTVLQHVVNMGPGAATRTGLHFARNNNYDLAITMDADGQHSAKDLPKIIAAMIKDPNIDLLIGNRLWRPGNMPTQKKVGNRMLSYITYLAFGAYVSDTQSGFRGFSKRALQQLNFHTNSYAFCSEMLWQAKRSGLIIAEQPIQTIYTKYSKSKGQKNYSGAFKIINHIMARRFMEFIVE